MRYRRFLIYSVLVLSAPFFMANFVQAEEPFSVAGNPGLVGRVLFVAHLEGRDQLMMLDLDEGKVRPVIKGPGNTMAPQWASNGKAIVFVSDRDGNRELYTSLWDGSLLERITQTPEHEDTPVWSEDGKEILFSRETSDTSMATRPATSSSSNLFALDRTSKQATQLTRFNGRNISPRYVPGKREVLYLTNRFWPGSRLCLLNRDSGLETFLFKDSGLSIGQPSYGKDASELFFVVTDKARRQIGMKDLNGKFLSLVADAGFVSEPTPLPEGRGILFVRRDNEGKSEIRFVNRTGKEQSILLASSVVIKGMSYSSVKTITVESQRLKEMPSVVLDPRVDAVVK